MKTEAYKYYQLVINDRPVVAEFVGEVPSDIIITKSKEFKANHVCQSQYLLPILKRTDAACCSQFQLSYLKIKKGKFLPPLLPAIFSSTDSQKMASKLHTYPFSKISHLKITFYLNISVRIFQGAFLTIILPEGCTHGSVCTHCGPSFGSIKSKQNHSPNCRLNKSSRNSNK